MTKCKLIKGLLGASALTALSAGTAFAQVPDANDFTEAGTTVSNTFTLDYEVNDTTQTQINNIGNETEFNVDRLVNLTVDTRGDTFVVANQTDALLQFILVNTGNDTHAYELSVEQVTTGDDFNTTSATPEFIFYDSAADTDTDGSLSVAERNAATPQIYNGSDIVPVLAPDEHAFVFVSQNIPAAVDADIGGVVLIADTQTITSADGAPLTFEETEADATLGNAADPLEVENVLADIDGVHTTTDVAADGAHSDRGDYIVESPDVSATKEVFGVDTAPCNIIDDPYAKTIENSEYFTPNSCVEYIIEVRNEGTTDATDIVLTDVLPANLTFEAAGVRGDLVFSASDLSAPSALTVCDGPGGACTVTLTDATLAAASGGTPSVGFLVIRATIN